MKLKFAVVWCQNFHLTCPSPAWDKLPVPHIHLWGQNQNVKAFTGWPAVVLIALTALWDQMFLEPMYITWPPSALLKGFVISDNYTFASPSVNVILHCWEAGSYGKENRRCRKVENSKQLCIRNVYVKNFSHTTAFVCVLPTYWYRTQPFLLFCHNLAVSGVPRRWLLKVAALKGSLFHYRMLLQSSLCTEKSLCKGTTAGKGEWCGSEMWFLSFPIKLLLQFEYHLSLAYFCKYFNRMVFISKILRGFAIFCEPLLLCRILHSCKNLVIKIPFHITDVRVI